MNKNFAVLMLKYERLNRNLNQINIRQYTTSKIRQKYININFDNNKNIDNNNNNDDDGNKLKTRFVRSIARFNEYNGTDNVPMITNQNDTGWIDSRAGRSRRDDGRGKQRRKLKRRLKRSRRRLGTRGPLLLY